MNTSTLSGQELTELVLTTIAEVTRYPRSILLPESELEDDLGIESVKRAEILGVLGQRFDLPPPDQAGDLGTLKTIGDVIAAVDRALKARGGAPVAAPPANPAPAVTAPATSELLDLSVAIAALKNSNTPAAAELGAVPYRNGGLNGVKTTGAVVKASPSIPAPVPVAAHARPTPVPAVPRPQPPAPAPISNRGANVANGPSPAPVPVASNAPRSGLEPFQGKVALVMGSSHGLGKAIAEHLARLGASVVVNSFHSPEEGAATVKALVSEGRDAIHSWGSAANPEQLEDVLQSVQGRFGHLDFLVWNASDARTAPLEALTSEDWDRAFRTDVVGFHRSAFRAAELMASRGGGKIVTITHPASQRCFDEFAALGTVKAALESLSRYLAIELGPKNIQVNTVSAGPCQEHLERYPNADRHVPRWEARAPGGQLPTEAAVAHAVAFLLSHDSSRMTGSIVTVDGGVLLST